MLVQPSSRYVMTSRGPLTHHSSTVAVGSAVYAQPHPPTAPPTHGPREPVAGGHAGDLGAWRGDVRSGQAAEPQATGSVTEVWFHAQHRCISMAAHAIPLSAAPAHQRTVNASRPSQGEISTNQSLGLHSSF